MSVPNPDVPRLKKEIDDDTTMFNTMLNSFNNYVKHEKASNTAFEKLTTDLTKAATLEKSKGLQNVYQEAAKRYKTIGVAQNVCVSSFDSLIL